LTRIFFATDIHGSQRCFMKFVNAAKVYRVDHLILGGDITGKMVIPIIEKGGFYEATYFGNTYKLQSNQLTEFEKFVADTGNYAYRTSEKEMEELRSDREKLETLFKRLILTRLDNWLNTIKERLKPMGVKVYISGGNDDFYEVEQVLKSSPYIIDPEGAVIDIDGHEMITSGYSNITPWRCPRDISEEELAEKIESMTSKLHEPTRAIFNLHVPPFNSGIDLAPKLDENLRPIVGATGTPEMIPVGSTAVRAAIERYQPLLGLHGHIHESRGFAKIGVTLCINPGSEYSEGILRGAFIELRQEGIKQYLLTEG